MESIYKFFRKHFIASEPNIRNLETDRGRLERHWFGCVLS